MLKVKLVNADTHTGLGSPVIARNAYATYDIMIGGVWAASIYGPMSLSLAGVAIKGIEYPRASGMLSPMEVFNNYLSTEPKEV